MLIEAPTITERDREVWTLREAEDLARARSRPMREREREALRQVQRFLRGCGPVYVGTSWGKDSVVVAHLVRTVDPCVPLVHGFFQSALPGSSKDGLAYTRRQNPYCAAVRDAFLSYFPMPYSEVAWGYEEEGRDIGDELRRAFPGHARFMGIRAQESGIRALSAKVHGVSTDKVCRPILRWSSGDVFAYLARHDLPVHPSYAMSMGGQIDRENLRVESVGGPEGVNFGRREWETFYYP